MKTKKMELYVHIPFCIQKCNYCDFCSFQASKETIDAYMKQLYREIGFWGKRLSGTMLSSIFIGGGTPSCIDAEYICCLCECIKEYFAWEPKIEITMEANPGTVDQQKLQKYYQAGIQRLSFGLQSTKEEELRYLGRIHTYEDFLNSYELARMTGFENINIDLMSGIPKQTMTSYEETLRAAASLKPEHISAYSLIVEDGTPFAQNPKLEQDLPSEEDEVQMYAMTGEILGEYGYEKYEISNYSLPGKECRHNLGYWSGIPYLGAGLNASSYLDQKRFDNPSKMKDYLELMTFEKPWQQAEELSIEAQIEEFMFLGLRKTEGVSKQEFKEKFHQSLDTLYQDVIENAIKQGWMKEKNQRLSLTEQGILISNQILCEFLL